MNFSNKLLANKRVSIWGFGYLGYTETIMLQSKGFFVDVYDFNEDRIEELRNNSIASNEYAQDLSSVNTKRVLDFSKIKAHTSNEISQMFENNVHIVSFPGKVINSNDNYLKKLSNLFLENFNALDGALILFQSAETPNNINENFLSTFDRELNCVAAFRSDWTLDEFFNNNSTKVIAGNNSTAIEMAKCFYDILKFEYKVLNSLVEAEIYEASKNTLNYLISAYANQLSIAYPSHDISEIMNLVLDNISTNNVLGFGLDGYKSPMSVHNLLKGSTYSEEMFVAQEVKNYNLSFPLVYADYIIRNNYKSVLFLGFSSGSNIKKSIEISPTAVMGEYLIKNGIEVFVDDPFYTEDEVTNVVSNMKKIDIYSANKADVIVIMSNHNKFKFLNQNLINELNIFDAKLVLDNTRMFEGFQFSNDTIYHCVGDGKLDILG